MMMTEALFMWRQMDVLNIEADVSERQPRVLDLHVLCGLYPSVT